MHPGDMQCSAVLCKVHFMHPSLAVTHMSMAQLCVWGFFIGALSGSFRPCIAQTSKLKCWYIYCTHETINTSLQYKSPPLSVLYLCVFCVWTLYLIVFGHHCVFVFVCILYLYFAWYCIWASLCICICVYLVFVLCIVLYLGILTSGSFLPFSATSSTAAGTALRVLTTPVEGIWHCIALPISCYCGASDIALHYLLLGFAVHCKSLQPLVEGIWHCKLQ